MSEENDDETSELLGITRNSDMEARHEHQITKRFRVIYSVTVILGVLSLILLLVWIKEYLGGFTWTSNPSIQFNWHPFLMTTGMIFLYGQSILLYRAARGSKKRILKISHAVLHFLAFILSVIGLQAVFDSHNLAKNPIPNMYSLHSWIGLTTVIFFACQFLVGFTTFLFPGLPLDLRSYYLDVHKNFGTGGFVLAVTAGLLGLYEKTFFRLQNTYSDLGNEAVLINLIGVVLISFGVLVLFAVTDPKYKRVPLPEDNMTVSLTQSGVADEAE